MSPRFKTIAGACALAVLALVTVAALGGCGKPAAPKKPAAAPVPVPTSTAQVPTTGVEPTTNDNAQTPTQTAPPAKAKPGIYKLPSGQSRVDGTLQHRDMENGIWVVVDAVPTAATPKSKVFFVISNPEVFDLMSFNNQYVEVIGTVADAQGAPVSKAGPQLVAHTVTKAPVP